MITFMALSQHAGEAAPPTLCIGYAPDPVRRAEENMGAPAPLCGSGFPRQLAFLFVRARAFAVSSFLDAPPRPPRRFFHLFPRFLFFARAPMSAVVFISDP